MLQTEEEKYEENKMKFDSACLRSGLADLAQIQNWRFFILREFAHKKFLCFCSGSVELQMHKNGVFFTPVKYIYMHIIPVSIWDGPYEYACMGFPFVYCAALYVYGVPMPYGSTIDYMHNRWMRLLSTLKQLNSPLQAVIHSALLQYWDLITRKLLDTSLHKINK